ncbi:MAG: hypothetical protein L6Q95_19730 [Planctomycetes bacterium]|nr:hypothetical protein [Planctomycetota bacterium]
MRRALVLALLVLGCASDRPVHPMRLEGFPGAPIEPGLFPLADGARWTFADREGKELTLAIRARDGTYALTGQTEGEAEIRIQEGFLEILYEGHLVDRPLKMEGAAGDRWEAAGATYTVFGYEETEVLGRTVRALVVAADRGMQRDLYWFARDLGWVRLRTERTGHTLRDARLVSFEGGGTTAPG